MDDECKFYQLGCKTGKRFSETVGNAVNDGLQSLVDGLIQGVVDTMTFVLTFWLRTPSSSLSEDSAVAARNTSSSTALMGRT